MEPKIWRVFISLGVPGLALGVFYMLNRAFDWKLERLPVAWAVVIMILFMILAFVITYRALTLWSPQSESKAKNDSQRSVYSVTVGKEANVSGRVAGRDILEGNKPTSNSAQDEKIQASIVVNEQASITGMVAGRDIIVQSGPLKDRVDELIDILNIRADKIIRSLSSHYHYVNVQKYLANFQELHAKHVEALKKGRLVLAHEIPIKIHELSEEIESDEFWARHRIETPDVEYSLDFDAFEHGPMISIYTDREKVSSYQLRGWGEEAKPETDQDRVRRAVELYERILGKI